MYAPNLYWLVKDERANAETKLSVIGGTMGLFTGFSLISGVEIVYFILKAIFSICKSRKKPISNIQ